MEGATTPNRMIATTIAAVIMRNSLYTRRLSGIGNVHRLTMGPTQVESSGHAVLRRTRVETSSDEVLTQRSMRLSSEKVRDGLYRGPQKDSQRGFIISREFRSDDDLSPSSGHPAGQTPTHDEGSRSAASEGPEISSEAPYSSPRSPAKVETKARPSGWPRFIAILIAAVVAVVASFAVGRITAPSDSDDGQAAPISMPVSTTTTVPPSTTTTSTSTTVAPTQPPTTSLPPPATTLAPIVAQPVADIALIVGPAVVQIETRSALGSGIIYSVDGLILTAAHVVDTSDDFVIVRLADGRAVNGEILGVHTATDVAVIKIEPLDGLQAAEIAPPDALRIGELAVALGSPYGLDQTVTAGIVSAIDRVVDGVIMVQTDAAINPGNSGGPLVDAFGRVIGINDLIFTESGGSQGVGFAISIDLAVIVAEQLVAGVDVQLARLGVVVTPATGATPGALVTEVSAGSAADTAGIEEGDIIVRVNGRAILDSDALRARVVKKRPGDTIELEIVREGENLTLSAELGAADA